MHRPPAASWDVRAGRWYARLLFFIAGLAGVSVLAFLVLQQWTSVHVLVLLVLIISLLGAAYGCRAAPVGTLRWDGEQWHWAALEEEALSALRCALDLQYCMLLRVTSETGHSIWCWVESGYMSPRWLAFRRAVISGRVGLVSKELPSL